MARPQRNDVDYFPHSVTHGKKMFIIRDMFGNDGYACWFMLLEELGKADRHYLDFQDNLAVKYLCTSFKLEEKTLLEIVNELVKMGEFDRELWDQEAILFSSKFVDSIQDAYKRRSNECVNKCSLIEFLYTLNRVSEGLCIRKPHSDGVYTNVNPQSKVKYSKVKESNAETHSLSEVEKPLDFDQPVEDDRLEKAVQKIAQFFGLNEVNQANHFNKIRGFVEAIESKGQLDYLGVQFTAYRKVKEQQGEKYRHSWQNFIGSPEKGFEDGKWNAENWADLLSKSSKKVEAIKASTDYSTLIARQLERRKELAQ